MVGHMNQRKALSKDERLGEAMLGVGIGMALCYWLLRAVIGQFEQPDTAFVDLLFGRRPEEMYDIFIVVCLFLFFASHAQDSMRKKRQAEAGLRESEEKYRTILTSIEEGYYEISPKLRFRFVNPATCRMLHRKNEAIVDRPIGEFLAAADVDKVQEAFGQVGRGDGPATVIECELVPDRGARKIVEMSVAQIPQGGTEPGGFRGIIRDVTEKKMMERKIIQSLRDVKEARTGVIMGLAKLAEYRDTDTGSHLERIREFTRILTVELRQMNGYAAYIDDDYIEDIYTSSILHDIGKVGVSDQILLKPGKLTPEEFEEIKKHPLIGGNALSSVDSHMQDTSFLTIGKQIAFYHHERWDGNGYPRGLAGDEIPLSARIVAVADVYDALTSKRCYKEAFSHRMAMDIILSEKGSHFDPDVVDAFLARAAEFDAIRRDFQA